MNKLENLEQAYKNEKNADAKIRMCAVLGAITKDGKQLFRIYKKFNAKIFLK